MTNRTASTNHVSLSDKAYKAGRIEPNQSTLDMLAKMRAESQACRDEEKRAGRKMTIAEIKAFLVEREEIRAALNEAKAEMLTSRMSRFERAFSIIDKYHFDTSDNFDARIDAVLLTREAMAHQIVAHL